MSNRITFGPHPQRLVLRIFGTELASSDDVLRLNEQGLPPVYYLPRHHVDMSLLEPSAASSHCPFKGDACYWSLVLGENRFEDAVWSYESPLPEMDAIAGRVAFWADRIGPALEIDLS